MRALYAPQDEAFSGVAEQQIQKFRPCLDQVVSKSVDCLLDGGNAFPGQGLADQATETCSEFRTRERLVEVASVVSLLRVAAAAFERQP